MFGLKESDFDQSFDVWPENWDVVRLFNNLQTQWEMMLCGGRFVYTGINYPSVFAVAKILSIEITPEFFDAFQVLEKEGLRHLNGAKQ